MHSLIAYSLKLDLTTGITEADVWLWGLGLQSGEGYKKCTLNFSETHTLNVHQITGNAMTCADLGKHPAFDHRNKCWIISIDYSLINITNFVT